MKKKTYILCAVLLAVILTAVQVLIADFTVRKHQQTLVTATQDIPAGTVVTPDMISEIQVHAQMQLNSPGREEIEGMVAKTDISTGEILSPGQFREPIREGADRFVSVSLDIASANAGDLKKYDVVDLFIVPDLALLQEHEMVWLTGKLLSCGVRYIPWHDGGILLENIPIESVYAHSGQSRKVISLRVERPMDLVLAFLKNAGIMELIRH